MAFLRVCFLLGGSSSLPLMKPSSAAVISSSSSISSLSFALYMSSVSSSVSGFGSPVIEVWLGLFFGFTHIFILSILSVQAYALSDSTCAFNYFYDYVIGA